MHSMKLHVETWAGLLRNQGLRFSKEVEIVPGVLLLCLVLHVLMTLLCHLGRAELFGTCWAGHLRRKQFGLGYGCSGVPLKGRICFFPSRSGRLGKEGIVPHKRGRSLVIPRTLFRTRTRMAPVSGHILIAGVWRAIAPLMKPWVC